MAWHPCRWERALLTWHIGDKCVAQIRGVSDASPSSVHCFGRERVLSFPCLVAIKLVLWARLADTRERLDFYPVGWPLLAVSHGPPTGYSKPLSRTLQAILQRCTHTVRSRQLWIAWILPACVTPGSISLTSLFVFVRMPTHPRRCNLWSLKANKAWAHAYTTTRIIYRHVYWRTASQYVIVMYILSIFQVFQSDGSFVGKMGSVGSRPGYLEHPSYIAVSSTNRVIVSDTNNHRVQVFDVNGRCQFTFGAEGSEEGLFRFPRGVAVDDQGYIVVADSGNNRIQVFQVNSQTVTFLTTSMLVTSCHIYGGLFLFYSSKGVCCIHVIDFLSGNLECNLLFLVNLGIHNSYLIHRQLEPDILLVF